MAGHLSVGHEFSVAIIGAAPLYLAGGQDASLVQNWYVAGSVPGRCRRCSTIPMRRPPILADRHRCWSSCSTLAASLCEGRKVSFSVEGGHYRWRKDAASPWTETSPPAAIPAGAVAFDAGLTIEFTPGASPSFVAGDVFSFRALQPWAVSNLKTPTVERWQWTGATADSLADLGAAYDLDTAGIALHTLPQGATILIEGGTSPGTYTWAETAVWRAGTIVAGFSATRTARYVRCSIAAATDGGIGWL